MHTTRISLIQAVASGEVEAWQEWDDIYRPLIQKWLGGYHLQPSDVADLTQEVMTAFVRKIEDFDHNGRIGALRNWLRTTTVNVARNYLHRQNLPAAGTSQIREMLLQLEDPHSSISGEFNLEHDRNLIRKLLERISKQFEPITLDIFQTHVVVGLGAVETAEKLKTTVASVHTAKSRVLRRLRQYAADWIDDI